MLYSRSRLNHLEKAEADRLLQFGIAVDFDIGPRPKRVQVSALVLDSADATRLMGRIDRRHDFISHRSDRWSGDQP